MGGGGGEPPGAWKRTPEKQLPAMWILVRVWLEGLAREAVSPLPRPQHLVSASSAVAAGTHTTLLGSELSPVKAMGWISPCLQQLQCPVNSIPPSTHLHPGARVSMTGGKRDLATAQMATLPIQREPPLCKLPIFCLFPSGLKYDLWYGRKWL